MRVKRKNSRSREAGSSPASGLLAGDYVQGQRRPIDRAGMDSVASVGRLSTGWAAGGVMQAYYHGDRSQVSRVTQFERELEKKAATFEWSGSKPPDR